ncbi:MAG: hypothetical protein H5T86_06290, partial [Armatimonadetes bacterium]|nr:hypothetical protein [Armatimonadota bacterium]
METKVYLLLVTFMAPNLARLTDGDLSVLDASPFAGVAVPVVSAYDTSPVPPAEDFRATVAMCRKHRIQVWPWVFLNRMIGRHAEGRSLHKDEPAEYFLRIPVLDLSNETGARKDFLDIWRLALRLARDLGAPGIVADFEAYNNYSAYDPRWTAEKRQESPEEVIDKLRGLGADLADIVADEYPGAAIWQLFFDPYYSPYRTPDGQLLTRTTNYVNLGMLDRAVDREIAVTVIDGGETALGYYSPTLERLEAKIRSRDEAARPFLEKYGSRMALAG